METLVVPTVEFARIADIWQIIDGAALCQQCPNDAVLFVSTEPDGEPGYACWEHAEPWLRLVNQMLIDIFGGAPTLRPVGE